MLCVIIFIFILMNYYFYSNIRIKGYSFIINLIIDLWSKIIFNDVKEIN